MLGAIKQIVVSYEQHGMTPDEIAEDQGLECAAVKAALSQHSSIYRKDVHQLKEDSDEGLDFTKEQLRQVNQVIFDTAIGATLPDGSVDHRARFKASEYVRNDFKGRLTPVRAIHKTNNLNLFQINEAIASARIGANHAKRQLTERALGQDCTRETTIEVSQEAELVAAQ